QKADALRTELAALERERDTVCQKRKANVNQAEAELARIGKSNLPPDVPGAYAVSEGTPGDARVQVRGEVGHQGPVVKRNALRFLSDKPLDIPRGASGRLQLAQWLTRPQNPLTARVLVNRLWQHHFGKGLVATPSNFGTRGEAPTHPELLDWL